MKNNSGDKLMNTGAFILRYGLVIVLLFVGALKFTAYEAEGIKPLVENSFLLSWAYHVMSVQAFAEVLGVTEILLAILIGMRKINPKISAIGSIGAIIMFGITLTLLLTTPASWQMGYGFPFLSPMPGQFLLKDIVLFGAAIWTAGEALSAAKDHSAIRSI